MLRRPLATLLLSSLLPLGLAGAQATTVPNEVQQPGTQPLEATLESVNKCDNCHGGYDSAVEPVHNWRGSMMALASRDPLFWATVAVAEQDFSGAGDLCIRCHTPEGWSGDRSTPTDGSALTGGDVDGVSCDACHQMTNPDDSEHVGVQNSPFVANDGGDPETGYYGGGMYVLWGQTEKLGPYSDPSSPHQSAQSLFHRSSAVCGTCHDVSNPVVGDLAHNNGSMTPLAMGSYSGVLGEEVSKKAAFNNFPYEYGIVERTYSEHVASALDTYPVASYGSLPPELQAGSIKKARDAAVAAVPPDGNYADSVVRTFTCQTCHMPPVQGKGCNKNNAPVRADLPLHDLTGANTWVPDAIQYQDDQDLLLIGGDLSEGETTALQEGSLRSAANLQEAAGLSLAGNVLRVVNLTGHKLISGYPEGRRMWLRIDWKDPWGGTLRLDGAYGPVSVLLDESPTVVNTIQDLEDPNLRIYEVHLGMTREWALQLLALGYSANKPLAFDRLTGEVEVTLGDIAAGAPGSAHETFHFALNNLVLLDTRIPPYGMGYDEALLRNILPVPASQFGDPGSGGTYQHWDDVPLNPPVGAATADIELLYQTTSWEYIQFLYLTNDGSVEFLADEGEKLLDTWLATGMAAPVTMETTTWDALPNDCNNNGVDDAVDIATGTSADCNADGLPDECNIAFGAGDRNENGVLDECEPKIKLAPKPPRNLTSTATRPGTP
jgi:hypothetical protein